ncbi:NDT-like domain-containing protein raw isoform X2 [Anticarsia gemmatalis]|uniref:NDT-like domain-containing protein raw isoform X2 n=1 Tax=Anticarsia gemmatalis TaxID=129554 RepID=UPI003F77401C
MKMEGGVLSVSSSNNRFRSHLKNAASAICARTLPKQRRGDSVAINSARHHTYPRATPTKRAAISCRMEPLMCTPAQHATTFEPPQPFTCDVVEDQTMNKPNGFIKLKGTLAREVASAWECRVGPPDQPASADRIQSLFNDIELYPTKTQVFEMLVCARQCARRKSLTLTFGEFCVFAAELRRCSRQARQTSNKPESPQWNLEKELRDKDALCKHVNGSEASPPPCEVFLGGSCNPTTWRSDIAIPILKKMGITYFNPQVEDWSTELMEVEHRAKAAARALLFVLDSETRAVAASVEAAHLAAAPRDLLLVLRPYSRHQTIGHEAISDHEYVELSRARATLQEAVERRGLPAFTDIPSALRCARAVLRGARTHPRHSLGHTIIRLKRTYDAAGGRNSRLPRAKAVDALKDVTRVPREVAEHCLPPGADTVDFETFCACVAELAADAESNSRNGQEAPGVGGAVTRSAGDARVLEPAASNGHMYNARLKAYGRKLGLIIPKNGGHRAATEVEGGAASPGSGDSVFTPGTERRLERLPAMLGAPTHDVYLGGTFPSNNTRPEELLRREGFSVVVARANDYTRMFSTPGRRAAPAYPESPRRDKKPRPAAPALSPPPAAAPAPSPAALELPDAVELRQRSPDERAERSDRLSASDFYTVTEDVTPQPFKGTYDEDLLLGSRVLVFAMSADSPCFAAMVLAAHYMGLRPAATVLLVQPMDPKKAHNYSEAAVKDYNRGRHYLSDLARRSGVPVFDNVDSVMSFVVSRLRATL